MNKAGRLENMLESHDKLGIYYREPTSHARVRGSKLSHFLTTRIATNAASEESQVASCSSFTIIIQSADQMRVSESLFRHELSIHGCHASLRHTYVGLGMAGSRNSQTTLQVELMDAVQY